MSSLVSGRLTTQPPPAPLRPNTRQSSTAANRGPSAAGTSASRRLARRRPAAVALGILMASPLARNPHP